MSTLILPWNDGSGQSLEITFSGKGNDTIKLSSPRNNTGNNRSLNLTVSMIGYSQVSKTVVVTQVAGEEFFVTEGQFIDKNKEDFLVSKSL